MPQPKRTPVIDNELANRLADHFTALGFNSPYSSIYGSRENPEASSTGPDGKYRPPVREFYQPSTPGMKGWMQDVNAADAVDVSAIIAEFGMSDLPNSWHLDVATVMQERSIAKLQAETRLAILNLDTTEGIREYLLADFDRNPHWQHPVRFDFSGIVERVKRITDQWHKPRPAWKTDPNCTCRLKLKEAVRARSEQQAYADVTMSLIPYQGEITDKNAARGRLSEFFRRADTHTGWAGSGVNYSVVDIDTERKFVIISCRASIAD